MKQFLIVALLFATATAFSQGRTLQQVYFVKPKMGQQLAFETAWKAHVSKFHNTEDKVNLYEVLTGPNAGSFHEIHGPLSFEDMDKERSNSAAHDADWVKTVAPFIESGQGPVIMGFRDSLSYKTDVQADKFLVNVFHIKPGMMSEFLAESKRGLTANMKRNVPWGTSFFVQNFAGSNPVVVTVRTLKDGFKELESDYYKLPDMKESYVKEFGQALWDRRMGSFLRDHTNAHEVMLMKHRKDLSSK